MKKLWAALAVYALLALIAWQTLTEPRFRLLTLVLLGFFAFKTLLHHHREEQEKAQVDEMAAEVEEHPAN
ncbi:MAG TPA: hypothetical protein VKZ53_14065 [Candidatus Angelobacter sp.]|nr:hypothetical protein [Candidatus Angelobacter sp.]